MRVYAPTLLVLLAVAQVADGAVLCRKRSGAVVLRDTCARRELPIDPVALGLQGPTGVDGPPGPPATALIKDSVGTLVGSWFVLPGVLPGEAGVLRALGGTVTFLRTEASGFVMSGWLYYESGGCGGTPYMLVTPGALVTTAAIGDGTAHLPSGPSTMRSYSSVAQLMAASPCAAVVGTFIPPDRCCFVSASSGELAPVQVIDLNALGLVPPFHAEMP